MIRKLNHPSSHSFSHPAKLPRYSIGKVAAATPSLEEVSQLHANLPSSHSHSAVDAIKGRGLLLKWLTHHLAGDQLAAEYVLLHCMSRVYRRIDDVKLGDLPLNLTGCGASTVFATYGRDKPTDVSTLLFFPTVCMCGCMFGAFATWTFSCGEHTADLVAALKMVLPRIVHLPLTCEGANACGCVLALTVK